MANSKSRANRRAKRLRWSRARVAETAYNTRLKAVARQVGAIVKGMAPGGKPKSPMALVASLKAYAEIIEPWARSVAQLMAADVAARDKAMWRKQSDEMSSALAQELNKAPTGAILQQLQGEQVRLIQSIPLEAAERVHKLTMESLLDSARADEIATKILATENVSVAKAQLIARTEVARASSNLVQARATFAGSDGYIWRTSEDGDVRESHAKMEGVYVRWSHPPKLDNMIGHAGTLPNCRCFAEPVFRDE